MKCPKYAKGWWGESDRHRLARYGIKTSKKGRGIYDLTEYPKLHWSSASPKVNYMYSPETIRDMNRERAKEAKSAGKKPLTYSGVPQDLRHIPNIGDYRPKGWKLVETYFVDNSGLGRRGEPALTFGEFARKAKVGKGYAVIEAGQFQVKIGEFEKIN